jgi:hypothetical protein
MVMTKYIEGYQCGKCGAIHKDLDRAELCCVTHNITYKGKSTLNKMYKG